MCQGEVVERGKVTALQFGNSKTENDRLVLLGQQYGQVEEHG